MGGRAHSSYQILVYSQVTVRTEEARLVAYKTLFLQQEVCNS